MGPLTVHEIETLRDRRFTLELSEERLAEQLGISLPTLRRILHMKGTSQPLTRYRVRKWLKETA